VSVELASFSPSLARGEDWEERLDCYDAVVETAGPELQQEIARHTEETTNVRHWRGKSPCRKSTFRNAHER